MSIANRFMQRKANQIEYKNLSGQTVRAEGSQLLLGDLVAVDRGKLGIDIVNRMSNAEITFINDMGADALGQWLMERAHKKIAGKTLLDQKLAAEIPTGVNVVPEQDGSGKFTVYSDGMDKMLAGPFDTEAEAYVEMAKILKAVVQTIMDDHFDNRRRQENNSLDVEGRKTAQAEPEPEEVPQEQPEEKQYDPAILEKAITSHDEILKKRLKQTALQFEYAAALSYKSGNKDRTAFYQYFKELVEALLAKFEQEVNPPNGYSLSEKE